MYFSRPLLALAPIIFLVAWFAIGLIDRLINFSVEKCVQRLAESHAYIASNL